MENKKRRIVKSVKIIITEDLMIQIISRVPVKDLVRFTCVSKAWCSLILTDSYFLRLQIQSTASLDRPFLLIQIRESGSFLRYLIDLESIEDENIKLQDIHSPLGYSDAYVLASCHGLLLLQKWGNQKMALSNPITLKHRNVPPNPAGDANVSFGGFGYDRAHDCYKLVTQIIKDNFEVTFELMIYNFNNDTWYRHQCNDGHRYPRARCFGKECVDGAQYWGFDTQTILPRDINKIICFVLAVEELHEVETPDLGEVMYYPNMTVLDGRLDLMMEDLYLERYEVWMIDMECDSNKAYSWRWTKILSLSDPSAMLLKEDVFMIPRCFSVCKTRILFDVTQMGLFWYDLGDHRFHKLNDDPVNGVDSRVNSFVPSLVGIGIF